MQFLDTESTGGGNVYLSARGQPHASNRSKIPPLRLVVGRTYLKNARDQRIALGMQLVSHSSGTNLEAELVEDLDS